MAINVEVQKKSNRPIVPKGNHLARVYSIIEIGLVEEEFQGEVKTMPKIRIGWELPNETYDFEYEKDGEKVTKNLPFVISQEYTLSLGKKANLRPVIEGIIGDLLTDIDAETFDVASVMGKTCMLDVRHKQSKNTGNDYAIVGAISSVPKGMDIPEPVNEPFVLEWSDFNEEKFDKLPDFIKDKIKSSHQWKEKNNVVDLGNEPQIDKEDIPF